MNKNKDNLKVASNSDDIKSTVDDESEKIRWKESTLEEEQDLNTELEMASVIIDKILSGEKITEEEIETITEESENAEETEAVELSEKDIKYSKAVKLIERIVPIVFGLVLAIIISTNYSNNLAMKDINNTKELCRLLNEMKDMTEIDSKTERKVYKLVKAGYWDNIREHNWLYDETIYHYLAYIRDTDLLEKFLNDKNWKENIEADYAGTPLQYAVLYSNDAAARLLLEHGADALSITNAKSEAYALAMHFDDAEMISLIEEFVSKDIYAKELKQRYDKVGYIAVINTDEELEVPLHEKEYKY